MPRILAIALSILPIIMIFVAGACWKIGGSAGKQIIGRPRPWVFITTWTSIGLFFIWILSVAAFRVTSLSYLYSLVGCALLISILCMMWIYFYTHERKNNSIQILAAILLFSIIFSNICSSVPSDNLDTRAAILIPSSLLSFWAIFATLLNLLDANKIC